MTLSLTAAPKPLLKRSAVALALAALCASASALPLPVFMLDPAGAGLKGASFRADSLGVFDYATVRITGNTFKETGFLQISSAALNGVAVVPGGLNINYGMYISFSGEGSTSLGNPGDISTSGTFKTLEYTLYGYNGPASFGFDSSNNPTETAAGEVVLATGKLISGTVNTQPAGGGGAFTPGAAANLTFATVATSAFFVAPQPFYNLAFSTFSNNRNQVTPFDGGFKISQGGGSLDFAAAPIPEPETYALMLAGLCAVGFVARRRKV